MRVRRAEALRRNPQAAAVARDLFLAHIELPTEYVIAGTVAHDEEIDVTPLVEALHAKGHRLCLPVVEGRGQPLSFRAFGPGDALESGYKGIPVPRPGAPLLVPDILLVPLLAFDDRCYRLGYGEGYYDRTLMDLRARKNILAVGMAFACQQVPEVPVNAHDAKLDRIVTEIQVF